MTSEDIPSERPFKIKYEQVSCALCGHDNTKVQLSVGSKDLHFNSLWYKGEEYKLERDATLVRCLNCGLVYVNPRIAEIPGISPYDEASEKKYFELTREDRSNVYYNLITELPGLLGRKPLSLLDYGCGDGLFLEIARQASIDAVGIEVSDSLIEAVSKKLGEDAIFDGRSDEIPKESFDVVTIINVLEHLREPRQTLEKAFSALRPGGILLVHVPNWGGWPARIYGAKWHQIAPHVHLHYYTSRTLGEMIRKSGGRPIDRFSLIVSKGIRGMIHRLLYRMGIYIDSGLGIVARKCD
ncbi:MAG: class I SAM-dependent methyltransferase [Anaerolineales bacterium]|jgi:2-polyprenyl-3-methyl-5-hydroxy-6-metoxy-1,4-benzoquinol methylase